MTREIGLAIVISTALWGQSPETKPEFEVADVQVSKAIKPEPGKPKFVGGRIELPNFTVKELLEVSYDVQENMISGGPKWLESDRFDIVAKAAPDTPLKNMLLMVQSLLADRFKLVFHREDRPMPVYAMILAAGGAKLQKASGGKMDCQWNTPDPGQVERACQNITMAELASQMPKWGRARVDLPVVDLTGIEGAYDIRLQWSATAGDADLGGSTIFNAMGQIGLKLEHRKQPLPVIVIDSAERRL